MTTVNDIIARAYRKLNISGASEPLDGSQITEGVDAFNDMLFAWKLKSVDVGHTAKAASDAFPLADEFIEGTVYLLASRLAPNYVVPAAFDADDWFRSIQAAYAEIPELTVDAALTRNWPSGDPRYL